MGLFTEFFHMFKPSKTDPAAIAKINEDLDTIDYEMHRPPLTVNGITPGQDRNLSLTEVPLAGNLSSDIAQIVTGAFTQRVSGGGASIEDGGAFLSTIKGNTVHTGQISESINMTVNAAQREEGVDAITATLDRDTFVAYVQASGTITLTYTTAWSANPALYGITVNGTPVSGDEIVVVYVKANRGLITVCNPTSFNATGWNLFNRAVGYARVCKYSDTYGFKIGGTYSLVEFATTVSGTRSTLTLEDGYFNVPSDGFVFVTGSDATTYIYATFTDWTEGYQGEFEAYSVDTIDLTEVMLAFPYGLCAVGNVRDEINLNTQTAIKRIERFGYSAENLAAVIASGVDYDADESYIYAVMQTPNTSAVSVNGDYAVSDHGIEYFIGSSIPVYTEVLYGENLKDKLRTDVLTISQQQLTNAQKAQVQQNIGLQPTQATDVSVPGYVADARIIEVLNNRTIVKNIPSTVSLYDDTVQENLDCVLNIAGNICTGYIIFKYKSDYAGGNGLQTVVKGLPLAKRYVQMPLICVSGTNSGKVGRVRVSNGVNNAILTFWYSNVVGSANEVYLIPINYILGD